MHTVAATAGYDNKYDFEIQMQDGSKLFPENPNNSISEEFAQLEKAVGIQSSTFLPI